MDERERLISEREAETINVIGDSYAAIDNVDDIEIVEEELP